MRHLKSIFLGAVLSIALATPALADPGTVPTSVWGGTFLMASADGTLVAFQMADGRVRWELEGMPLSAWGVNDIARASSVGYSDPSVLVPGGMVRGVYVAASEDGSWMAFMMPDLSMRWEHNGIPASMP